MKKQRKIRPLEVSLLDRLGEDVKTALRKAVTTGGKSRKEKES